MHVGYEAARHYMSYPFMHVGLSSPFSQPCELPAFGIVTDTERLL